MAIAMGAKEVQQASLKLVDRHQSIFDCVSGVVRYANLLQSGVVKPMDRARGSDYRSYGRQALRSTQRMIEVLEKITVRSDRCERIRAVLVLFEEAADSNRSASDR